MGRRATSLERGIGRSCYGDDELVIKLSAVGGRSPLCRVSKDRVRRDSQCPAAVFRTSGDRTAEGPPPAGPSACLVAVVTCRRRALRTTCLVRVRCFAGVSRRRAPTSTAYILAPARKKSTRNANVGLPLTSASVVAVALLAERHRLELLHIRGLFLEPGDDPVEVTRGLAAHRHADRASVIDRAHAIPAHLVLGE